MLLIEDLFSNLRNRENISRLIVKKQRQQAHRFYQIDSYSKFSPPVLQVFLYDCFGKSKLYVPEGELYFRSTGINECCVYSVYKINSKMV